jgi:hypothetical protein
MQGSAKYGGVVLMGVRARDNLKVRLGTATTYKTGRDHAHLILASSSQWDRIHIRDTKGNRITTVHKVKVGERRLD